MNGFGQGFAEGLMRLLAQLPGAIGRALPSWLAKKAQGYLKWLWRLDFIARLAMVAVTIVVVNVGLGALPGPHAFFVELGEIAGIGLMFFLIASLLFGGGRA
jgi:hypothetical protein